MSAFDGGQFPASSETYPHCTEEGDVSFACSKLNPGRPLEEIIIPLGRWKLLLSHSTLSVIVLLLWLFPSCDGQHG